MARQLGTALIVRQSCHAPAELHPFCERNQADQHAYQAEPAGAGEGKHRTRN